MVRKLHKYVCMAAIGVAAVGAPAWQEPASPALAPCAPPCLHDHVLQRLPASIEVIVALNGASKQRSSPAGQALVNALHASGSWVRTLQAWEALSASLEWTPARTFDEVLGTRSSFVLRGLADPEGPEWVILTAVKSSTQHRLRDRLRAAPRSAISGLSVLSIEDGSFQLLVAPCPVAAASGTDSSLVLLAPRSSEKLMEEVAPLLVKQSESPPGSGWGGVGGGCDVVVSVRPRGSVRPTMSLTARQEDNGWDASIVCEPASFLGVESSVVEAARAMLPWPDSLFRDLDAGSMLSVMSIGGMQELPLLPEPLQSWKKALSSLALNSDPEATMPQGGAGANAGLRTGIFVRGIGPAPATAMVRVSGRSSSARADLAELQDSDSPRGRLSMTVMAETRKPRETLVEGDAVMTRVATMLMVGQAEAAEPSLGAGRVRFEVPYSGPREVSLGEGVNGLPLHPSVEPVICRAFGEEASLSWRLVEARANESTSWWLGSLAPKREAGANARELRVLSSRPTSGDSRRWLSFGSMKPRAVARWLEALDMRGLGCPAGADSLAAARFIETLQWDAYFRADGQIGAEVRVRMAIDASR